MIAKEQTEIYITFNWYYAPLLNLTFSPYSHQKKKKKQYFVFMLLHMTLWTNLDNNIF